VISWKFFLKTNLGAGYESSPLMYLTTFGGIGQVYGIGVNVVRDLSSSNGGYRHSIIVVVGSVI
jgi:hypothetical protein